MSAEQQIQKAEEYAEKQKLKNEVDRIKHQYDGQKKTISTSKLIKCEHTLVTLVMS